MTSYLDKTNLDFLLKSQWLSKEEIEKIQLEGFKHLVAHAKKTTMYYKSYKLPETLEDLKSYPILTKTQIRKNFKALISIGTPSRRQWTAGTSEQVTILKNKVKKHLIAGQKRFSSWYECLYNYPQKFKSWNKEVCVWGELPFTQPRFRETENTLYLPIVALNDEPSALFYIRKIKSFKPVQLRAYSTALVMIAYYIQKNKIELPSIKVVISNAEPVDEKTRNYVQKAFKCPLFNLYGSRDLGSMAQDCEQHKGLHLFAEKYILEVGKNKQFIWTDLMNYAFPLIRYENGDTGEFSNSKCDCGRGLPMIKEIIGRKHCWLLLSNGEWLHSTEFNAYLLKKYLTYHKLIYPYQIRQEQQGKAMFLLWMKKIDIPKFKDLINHFKALGLKITIDSIESIPRYGRSRKILTCVSKFTPPWETPRQSFIS